MLLMARSNHTDNGHRILTQGAGQNLYQQPPEYIFPFLAMMGIPAQLKSLVGWKAFLQKDSFNSTEHHVSVARAANSLQSEYISY